MITDENYNPCNEHIIYLKENLKAELVLSKDIRIFYDVGVFITNINKSEIDVLKLHDYLNYYFNDRDFLVIKPSIRFYNDDINKCPIFDYMVIDDLYLDGIAKRMYAQIEFGFFHEEIISANEAELCKIIFKSLYAKSVPIKKININLALEKYNNLQREGYLNKMIIYGIIYAVYDYYNYIQNK